MKVFIRKPSRCAWALSFSIVSVNTLAHPAGNGVASDHIHFSLASFAVIGLFLGAYFLLARVLRKAGKESVKSVSSANSAEKSRDTR